MEKLRLKCRELERKVDMTAAINGKTRYSVAVDVMGGDNAPHEIVKGALESARIREIDVVLVGDADVIRGLLPEELDENVKLVPSKGVIGEDDHPVEALKQKPEASIIVCAQLVKSKLADAYITMGSTGAAMAAGVMALGTIEGIDRPALGGPFLGFAPKTTLLDLGTSIDCRPSQLLGYGVLGSVFAKVFMGIQNPRVALLSVGSEEGKGNRQVREAYGLFSQSGLNFIGNVEGVDVPLGKADVVVCDGFVGNILMKFAEGLGMAVVQYFKDFFSGTHSDLGEEVLGELSKLTNSVEHMGGGPLLGLDGVAIVGHGRSKAASVSAAVDMACRVLNTDLVNSMKYDLQEVRQRVSENKEG